MRAVNRVDPNYNMSSENWESVLDTIEIADILLTLDCATLGVDHGHAALVVSATNTVEHYGPADKNIPGANGKSGQYKIENLWSHTKTCAVIRYDGISRYNQYAISGYAVNHLVGWNYFPTAIKTDDNLLNCATLIWKAYKYAGYDLKSASDGSLNTMFPADFTRSEINPYLKTMIKINEN